MSKDAAFTVSPNHLACHPPEGAGGRRQASTPRAYISTRQTPYDSILVLSYTREKYAYLRATEHGTARPNKSRHTDCSTWPKTEYYCCLESTSYATLPSVELFCDRRHPHTHARTLDRETYRSDTRAHLRTKLSSTIAALATCGQLDVVIGFTKTVFSRCMYYLTAEWKVLCCLYSNMLKPRVASFYVCSGNYM